MVGAVLHLARDAAGHDQLGHADHRPAQPRAQSSHEPARARLGDPRLHDRLDRAGPQRGPSVGPVRAQARLRRGLHRVRVRLARGRIRIRRHRADPVADSAGDRRRVPVRQRGRDRDRRLPPRAAGSGDGHQHDGRRDRPRDRAGARRRAGRAQLALGVLVQRPVRPRRQPLGRARPARGDRPIGGPVV